MNGFGIFSLLAGGLQLTVPSYGLRLIRRFGASRVGWFLVIAFLSLALMHAIRPSIIEPDSFSTQAFYAIGSVLLLVGFGHLETLWSRDGEARSRQDSMKRQWLQQSEERSTVLAQTNQELSDALKRLEDEARRLVDSEAQFRTLFEDHPQPMWIFDLRSMRFLAVNRKALKQFGFTQQEFMNLNVPDLFAPDCAGGFLKDAARPCTRSEVRGLWRQRRKDRSTFELELMAMDLRFENYPARWIIGSDTTQRDAQAAAAIENSKLDTMARLAGGVAHHFNNALTIVDGKATLLLKNPIDSAIEQPIKDISAAANRMAGMTRQLLAVGRQHPMTREAVEVKSLLQTLYPTLRRLVGNNVNLINLCGSALPPIWGDARLIEQMFIHLVHNARRAMAGSGTLTISASNIRRDNPDAEISENVRPGEYIRIAFRDSGCGMTPDVQARIFEPFFTTHEPGKAVGLGLASVYGAAKQHGGWLEFTSEPGVGSEFVIFLPCSTRPVEQKAVAPSETATSTRGKTILVVEPDDRARGATCYLLKREGYRVIEADCAATVKLLWERQGSAVDLIITDVNLPGETSGRELGHQLLESKPGLRILYSACTGGMSDSELSGDLISKPYQSDALLKAVEKRLAS